MNNNNFIETVTISLKRYNELIEAEKKSKKEYPHTIVTSTNIYCTMWVETDSDAVARLSEELKISMQKENELSKRIKEVGKMKVKEFKKWRKQL